MADEYKLTLTTKALKSVSQIQSSLNTKGKNPFEFSTEESGIYYYFPSNWKEMSKNSYLSVLLEVAVEVTGAHALVLKEAKSSYKLNIEGKNLTLLQSFGLILSSRAIPDPPENQVIKQGIHSSLKCLMKNPLCENYPVQYFKFATADTIHKLLLGDDWGKNYQIEGSILSFIVHAIRVAKINIDGLFKYRKSTESVLNQSGLSFSEHKSELLSANEQKFVDTYLLSLQLTKFKEEVKSNAGIIAFDKYVKSSLTKGKDYKRCIRDITNRRITTVYSQFKNQREKQKSAKVPITKLMANIKDDPIKMSVFNPSDTLSLIKIKAPNFSAYSKEAFEKAYSSLREQVLGSNAPSNLKQEAQILLGDYGSYLDLILTLTH